MELSNKPYIILPLPEGELQKINRDLYEIKQLLGRLEQSRNQVVVEWRPLQEFLTATCWQKTQFYEKKKSGKFPENLFKKVGRKVFVHSSAFERYFAGDFD